MSDKQCDIPTLHVGRKLRVVAMLMLLVGIGASGVMLLAASGMMDGTLAALSPLPFFAGLVVWVLCLGLARLSEDVQAMAAALQRLASPAATPNPGGLACPHCGNGLAALTPGRNVCAHCGGEFEAE